MGIGGNMLERRRETIGKGDLISRIIEIEWDMFSRIKSVQGRVG